MLSKLPWFSKTIKSLFIERSSCPKLHQWKDQTMEFPDETIAEFCLITEAETSTAKYYLDAASGDLDVAVGLFMESSASASARTDAVREPIQPKMSILAEETGSSRLSDRETARLLDRHRSHIAASSNLTENSIFGRQSGALASGEQDNEGGTRQRLAYLFRAPTEIMFKEGGFEDAKRVAKRPFEERPFRYLLVTIHVTTEFSCQAMNRDVWNDKLVQQIVKQNFVFLQLTDGTVEADRFVSFYAIGTTDVPFVAIIDPRTGEKAREWMDKKWTASEMVEALLEFLSLAESTKDDMNEAPSISGPSDMPQSPDSSRIDNGGDTSTKEKNQHLFLDPEPEASDPKATLIQFRLPNGNKLRRRFLINAPISSLFEFLNSAQVPLPHSYKLRSTLDTFTANDDRTLSEGDLRNVSLTIIDDSIDSK